MRKISVLLALVTAVAVSSAAVAQPKKKIDTSDPNENSKRFVRDALPLFMPSVVMFAMLAQKQMDEQRAKELQTQRPRRRR